MLAALPYFATPYYVGLATTAMIAAMLALALHLLVGATGLVSLGHGAFYGLAAYVVYLLSPEGAARPIWQTLPVAMVVAGVAALAVGALSLRTRGFFFLMVTLAFGQMIFFVFHDTKLGGGTDGAYLAKPLIAAFGFELSPPSFPRAQARLAGLLRRARAARRDLADARVPAALAVRPRARGHPGERAAHAGARASTPIATSSPPSPSPACWPAPPGTCGACTPGS